MGFVARRCRAALLSALAMTLAVTLVLALAAVAAPATAGSAPARADRPAPLPLRVMVVGDSISQGQTGSATWRYWLWRESRRQGVDIRLVGPRRWPRHGTYYEHLDHGFGEQTWHAARSGSRYQWHIDRVAGLVATHRPDVVLTELGYNDLRVGDASSDRRTARLALTYTRTVLDADPTVQLVLGEIPGSSRKPPRFAAGKTRLAARTDARIERKLGRLGSPRVSRADLRTNPARPWRPARHTFDGTHPNSTGETLLAHHFAAALHRLGHLPQRPSVFHTEPWEPRPRFNAKQQRDGAVALWWGKDARRIRADSYLARVRVGQRVRRFRPRPSSAIVVSLPRGRYAVRMVAQRGSMTSRPGPLRYVTIR